MANKYPTAELVGVVMTQTNSGQYEPKEETLDEQAFHSWRIGKHTKGKLGKPGQLFLTENNMTIMLVAVKDLSFKERHNITPMARFLTVSAPENIISEVLDIYKK